MSLVTSVTSVTSICRMCTMGCPIRVEMEDGRIVHVEGLKGTSTYQGFFCTRGQSVLDHFHHPDRLFHSQKRQPDGSYKDIPVDVALDEIAQKSLDLIDEFGPASIAQYVGTFSAVYPMGAAFAAAWMRSFQSPMFFSSMTIDQPGKDVAASFLGRWMAGPQAFETSDVCMLVGTNPLVSYSGGHVTFQNPAKHLKDRLKAGMKLIVIDPRRTETARLAHIHLQPRPGEDASILAGIVHVVLKENLIDRDFINENVEGVEALRKAVDPFTPAYAAQRADVPENLIIEAARVFSLHGPGIVAGGTGSNMSGHSNLVEYLMLVLNTLCGRWLREGERVRNPGVFLPRAIPKAQAEPPRPVTGLGPKLRIRNLEMGPYGMPTAALAEEILLEGNGQIHGLFSLGGNPVAAWPNQALTVEALKKVDLFVAIDIKMSASAKLADYIIAPKVSFEVPAISYAAESVEAYGVHAGLHEPFGMYAPKLVDPPEGSDLIEEWEFYYDLAKRMEKPLVLHPVATTASAIERETKDIVAIDMENKPTTDEVLKLVTQGSRISIEEVRRHPHGAVFNDEEDVGVTAPKDEDCSARLAVGNEQMLSELAGIRTEPIVAERYADFPFLLISRRNLHSFNSTARDLPKLRQKGGSSHNPAFMHPDDLAENGIKAGDVVQIRSRHASISGIVASDDTLRRGLVSMTHAYGDLPGGNDDIRAHGSNTGALLRTDDEYDKLSGIPRMSGLPVQVVALPS